jgi:hypothetical protein
MKRTPTPTSQSFAFSNSDTLALQRKRPGPGHGRRCGHHDRSGDHNGWHHGRRRPTTIVRRDETGSGRFGSAGRFAAIVGQLRPATGHHDRRAGLQLTAGDAGGASAREGNVHGASRREEKATARSEQRPAHGRRHDGGGYADLAAAAVELFFSFVRSFVRSTVD